MTLVGLDLNATRARAVAGPAHSIPAAVALEGEHPDLPLAVSLQERHPAVGRAGSGLCRRSPHLACLDFLPHIGTPREWSAGRHRIDAARALGLVFEYLQARLGRPQGVAITLPAYLSAANAGLIARAAEKARLHLLGAVPAPLAAILAAREQLPWTGRALVVDCDGHGLGWSAVDVGHDQARLLGSQLAPHLAQTAWLLRLLDGVARRCVRLSRRDPRESAETEQSVYDQLAEVLESAPGGPTTTGLVDLIVQAPQWSQHLQVHPDELTACCAPLVQQALTEIQAFRRTTATQGPVAVVVLTAAAARLPGLAAALEHHVVPPVASPRPAEDFGDFGENLMLDDSAAAARVTVLDDDAIARAAHHLAELFQQGTLPRGLLEGVPLPAAPLPEDPGPARLQFRGQEHLLSSGTFTLGRDPRCDLVFESELYPSVSARHCEIVFDRRVYTLRDRSRHGTLVNDQPVAQQVALHSGDWIRLGPAGPVLRFLGQASGSGHWVMASG
jgi:hypothetical protein